MGDYTLNPADKHTDITLSNGNKTALNASGPSNYRSVRGIEFIAPLEQKRYWEVLANQAVTNGNMAIGIANSAFNTADRAGENINSLAIGSFGIIRFNAVTIFSLAAFASGTIMQFAYESPKLWIGVNGTWVNSGDPAAGTGAVKDDLAGLWKIVFSLADTGSGEAEGAATLIDASADWIYTAPDGFSSIQGDVTAPASLVLPGSGALFGPNGQPLSNQSNIRGVVRNSEHLDESADEWKGKFNTDSNGVPTGFTPSLELAGVTGDKKLFLWSQHSGVPFQQGQNQSMGPITITVP